MGDSINAVKAKELLEQGNERYRAANANDGDIGPALRQSLYEQGQHPFATVITCSDSRVVPEHIFMAGLGQLFTVRVAGNIIGATQLASVVYGVEHLGTKLVVVLGHTGCGAVAAALQGDAEGCLHNLIGPIRKAIGGETDATRASEANIRCQVQNLSTNPEMVRLIEDEGVEVVGALYRADSGIVCWL